MSTGSLISVGEGNANPENPNPSGENNPNPEAGSGSAENDSKLDPFKDLETYKDAESGMYFGRYKSIQDAFKGMDELQKEHGELKRIKAPEVPEKPEEYELTFGEDSLFNGVKVTMEDPAFKAMAPVFKEAGLSKEQSQKVIEGYLNHLASLQMDPETEKKKLGGDADKIIGEVMAYTKKANTDGMKKLAELAGTDAEMLKSLHVLIKNTGEKSIPTDLNPLGGSFRTFGEAQEAARKYKEEHAKTIDTNAHQQKTYYTMLEAAQRLKKK